MIQSAFGPFFVFILKKNLDVSTQNKTKQNTARMLTESLPDLTTESAVFCFVLFCRLAKTTILGDSGDGSRSEATFLRGPKAPRAPWARSEATF